MNSTVSLSNDAFKLAVEQPAESRSRHNPTQHSDSRVAFERLVDDVVNTENTSNDKVLMVSSRSDASVSEWVAAVTMSKLALGQFATNFRQVTAITRTPVEKPQASDNLLVQRREIVTAKSQTLMSAVAGGAPRPVLPIVAPITDGGAASGSSSIIVPAFKQKASIGKPYMAEQIAQRFVRIIGPDDDATLYIRDYLQPKTQLQHDVRLLLQALQAGDAYKNLIINGSNQSRDIL